MILNGVMCTIERKSYNITICKWNQSWYLCLINYLLIQFYLITGKTSVHQLLSDMPLLYFWKCNGVAIGQRIAMAGDLKKRRKYMFNKLAFCSFINNSRVWSISNVNWLITCTIIAIYLFIVALYYRVG